MVCLSYFDQTSDGFLVSHMAIPAEIGLGRLPSGPDGVTQRSSLYKETPGPGPLPVGVPSKLLLYYKAPTA